MNKTLLIENKIQKYIRKVLSEDTIVCNVILTAYRSRYRHVSL